MNQPLLQMDLRLVGVAVIVLAAAVIAIWLIGRRLRHELGPTRTLGSAHPPLMPTANVPPQVVKALQQRGLATPAQLATMTEMERHLLFSSMATAINEEAESDASTRNRARPVLRPEDLPTLYCPTCSYRIERFSSTLPITGQCETCGAKVVVRRDGGRILLTVLPKDDPLAARPDLRLEP